MKVWTTLLRSFGFVWIMLGVIAIILGIVGTNTAFAFAGPMRGRRTWSSWTITEGSEDV